MKVNNEKGFTLVEMIMVLAIIAVFVTAMTSILISTTKWSANVIKENDNKMIVSNFFPHVERSLLKYGTKNAIEVGEIAAGYDNVIAIDTDVINFSSLRLFYFYEKTEKKLYFQASGRFDPFDRVQTIEIASDVEEYKVTLSQIKKTINIVVKIKQKDGIKEFSKTIPLKAF